MKIRRLGLTNRRAAPYNKPYLDVRQPTFKCKRLRSSLLIPYLIPTLNVSAYIPPYKCKRFLPLPLLSPTRPTLSSPPYAACEFFHKRFFPHPLLSHKWREMSREKKINFGVDFGAILWYNGSGAQNP